MSNFLRPSNPLYWRFGVVAIGWENHSSVDGTAISKLATMSKTGSAGGVRSDGVDAYVSVSSLFCHAPDQTIYPELRRAV